MKRILSITMVLAVLLACSVPALAITKPTNLSPLYVLQDGKLAPNTLDLSKDVYIGQVSGGAVQGYKMDGYGFYYNADATDDEVWAVYGYFTNNKLSGEGFAIYKGEKKLFGAEQRSDGRYYDLNNKAVNATVVTNETSEYTYIKVMPNNPQDGSSIAAYVWKNGQIIVARLDESNQTWNGLTYQWKPDESSLVVAEYQNGTYTGELYKRENGVNYLGTIVSGGVTWKRVP